MHDADDLLLLADPRTPFIDRFARLGLSFDGPAIMGVRSVYPRAVLSTYRVLEPALVLYARPDSASPFLAVRRSSQSQTPWSVTETGICDAGSCVARHVFIDEASTLTEMTFAVGELAAELLVTGCAKTNDELYMLPFFDDAKVIGRQAELRAEEASVILTLRGDESALPQVRVRLTLLDPEAEMLISTAPLWSPGSASEPGTPQFYGWKLALAPRATVTLRFRIDIQAAGHNQYLPDLPAAEGADIENIVAERRAYHRAVATRAGSDLRVRAANALLRDCYHGDGRGEFGNGIASLCTADSSDFSCSFFWDSLFSAVALAHLDRDCSRGAIATAFTRQDDRDGSTPERKWDHCVPQRMFQQSPQSPVATWALLRHLEMFPEDTPFAERLYPALRRNHLFWRDYSDTDRDGLAEYRWTGQFSDNSPLWDAYGLADGKPAGCQWVPPVASVPLNSFLYRDAVHLAELAARLGLCDDVDVWQSRARAIADALVRVCYVEHERRFWDFNHQTRAHRRIRTIWMFWPLWAGVPMPADARRSLVEDMLLDPRQFFGPIPFPSVAYDEPSYDPRGYCRGRAWPQLSYWLIETLWTLGYHREADEAADRTLSWMSAQIGQLENLCTDPAEPNPGSFPDYNWGCAAIFLLDLRAYRRKPTADPSTK